MLRAQQHHQAQHTHQAVSAQFVSQREHLLLISDGNSMHAALMV
jgi:hypothetical protein